MPEHDELTEWIDIDDDDGSEAPPVGSDEELDESGYDAADDPASAPPDGSLPPTTTPTRDKIVWPVAKAAIPSWVDQHGNGRIPAEQMVKVAPLGGTAGHLTPEAAAAWRNLQNAASAAGFTLTMTGAYRSLAQQEQLFQERFVATITGGTAKEWNGKTFWLKPNMAMASVPGRSNHGWGCAVDMALGGYGSSAKNVNSSAAFLAWVKENAGPHGWSWEVQSEPWHVRLVSFAEATKFVGNKGVTPHQAPLPTLKEGSNGGQVAALQTLCTLHKWGDVGRPDGQFGPRTKEGVKAMQTALSQTVDGMYGPKSAKALGDFLAALSAG